ncbi:hypothetical protein Pcar_0899 [Syntrophotalea carbinolica DSM 2380]|uniref:SWIM-type domain-containing protein n=1 Tax=Syntrophotalea carbinolica (strain DSM 2380 / NBRC 103641 / GraBd1) TaxID=338963 RepID=Q3A653_SYNC1|nr:SWIM zinc finger family protein [Syntrophotalea carbinolica]ABA88154.1 hypothetical protein Pcar_0899 [Syntrophotalea carbinolica DSM 2380]
MQSIREKFKDLTHEDLRDWAGDRIYQRGKDYTSCVSQLSRTEDGTLVAWVSGNDEYATWVRHEGQADFDYNCTCPYDYGPCKHAVAVLLAAASRIRQRKEIPLLAPDDELYLEAFETAQDDWDDEDDTAPSFVPPAPGTIKSAQNLEKLLAEKSRDQLQRLLVNLAGEFPDVARRIREKGQLESGKVDQLVRSLRKEIRKLTAQEAWYSHWEHRGNLPDYSHLEKQLLALLNNGNADAVMELGEELWTRGIEQVEQSDDEGMTAEAISACLAIVLKALPQTSLSPAEQLLWLAKHELDDQYGLLGDIDSIVNNPRYTPQHWREVAAAIEEMLGRLKVSKTSEFSKRYYRERLVLRLRDVYVRAEQTAKVIPLLEREAPHTHCYKELVKALRNAGDFDRARAWCIKGFRKTIKKAPGIADGLQRQLRKLATDEGRFDLVAAYRSQDFFRHPSDEAYLALKEAAEKIDVWQAVRCAVLDYLRTGNLPVKDGFHLSWPLPVPEIEFEQAQTPSRRLNFPNWELLIEIAILEKRLDDAVAIYQERPAARHWGYSVDEALAKAVAASHPDIALRIWHTIAESLIGQVKPKAYKEAAKYLRKMHQVFQQTARQGDWTALIQDLRIRHKAKRRLMQVLDELTKNRKLV